MKLLAIAVAIGSLVACSGSGGGGSSTPTAPSAPVADANINGSYNVTITASSNCSANLPSSTRVLTYVADVAQHNAIVQVTLLAHVIWNSVSVVGTVSGNTVTFSNFSFSEITTGGGVGHSGTGTANVAANGSISGTLNGTLQSASGSSCNAANHQIQMTKR